MTIITKTRTLLCGGSVAAACLLPVEVAVDAFAGARIRPAHGSPPR